MDKGIIYTVSIGHSKAHITPEAQEVLKSTDVVAGHQSFIEIAGDFLKHSIEVIDNRETRKYASTFEIAQQNRVAACVTEALKGKKVAVLSGGDTGIWGEAGFFIEAQKIHENAFDVVVIPGVSCIVASAARVGAPLMNGFALIALGDEDTPFEVVGRRLEGAAIGGFTIVLYKVIVESHSFPEFYPQEKYPELNPPEKCTEFRLKETHTILSKYIAQETPMAIITDVYNQTSSHKTNEKMIGSQNGREEIILTTFSNFLNFSSNYRFFTTIIIGDETTKQNMNYIYTPQWNYRWVYSQKMTGLIKDIPYLKKLPDFFASL
jgi:precorrin-3B C17-methyltransferase